MKKTTKRIKTTAPLLRTREDVERAVRQVCELKAFSQETAALMDQRILEIKADYEAQLGDAAQEIDLHVESLRAWAEANPGEFEKKKSLELTSGIIGFRTGTPKLKTITGWTWDRVLEAIKWNKLNEWVRVKEEVNKDAILAERNDHTPVALRAIGVQIVQDESFYVEPNLTEVENRETVTTEN